MQRDKDQPADVGYFEVEPVLTPGSLMVITLRHARGMWPSSLLRLCPYLSRRTCSAHGVHRARPVFRFRFPMAGLPADLLRPTTRLSSMTVRRQSRGCRMQFAMRIKKQPGLAWNTTVSWPFPRRGRSMMKTQHGLDYYGNRGRNGQQRDALRHGSDGRLAWRMHQRMRKRYRNRVDARRKKQEVLLNTLRACFGLKPV